MEKTLHCGVNAYGNANKANWWEQLNVSNQTESFIAMLDKPMTRSETDSNALPGGRLTRRHETNYARQRDVRNVTYRRDGKSQSTFEVQRHNGK